MPTRSLAWGCALTAALLPAAALAAPVIETTDRMEVNWGTQHIHFYGESSVANDAGGEGYRGAEKRAWQNGVQYINQAIRELNTATNQSLAPSPDKLAEDAKLAAKNVAASTNSLYTTYYGDGTVRVQLDTTLAKALDSSAIHFRQKEGTEPTTQFTGLVLESDKALKPAAMYQVADETGAVLYDVKDMAQDAYRKRLMGRWYKKPTTAELTDAIGKSPVTVHATVKDGHFVVSREEWDKALEGHKSLLVNGSVVVALP